MHKIYSIKNIQECIQLIKDERCGFITNFFLDKIKHSLWIKNGELYQINYRQCIFLFRNCGQFKSLFFFASNLDTLDNGLKSLSNILTDKLVLDIVGRRENPIINILKSNGFLHYETLYRMIRLGFPNNQDNIDEHISFATIDDANYIKHLLDSNFNPLSEQIPSAKEIWLYAKEQHILIYKQENNVLGFIIFELNGVTLYLRYWFVSPENRDLHIGAKLFKAFMNKGIHTKRQLFWVIAKNENAIKRYLHYGFKAENMFDYVLIKN